MTTVQEFNTSTTNRTLSIEEQATFIAQAEQDIARTMKKLNQYFWERKPKMENLRSTTRHISYRPPSIKQRVSRPEIGVFAYVTEEQINHWKSVPQFQYYLYVFSAGSDTAEAKVVDQGYDLEGDATITITEIEQRHVVINTKSGKMTILL
ncbi:TPA: hypothetical protein DEP58_04755 [Patescibacteria group bacterium]|nr:MAG: hypothetical protein UU98_C0011G0029 [Parcubacteria group bacterium GW2011_GWD2_42_14]HCC05575.1 hypothetical protein [Patescibacteria group bacterium]